MLLAIRVMIQLSRRKRHADNPRNEKLRSMQLQGEVQGPREHERDQFVAGKRDIVRQEKARDNQDH
jgi:hypothetical protein